MLIQAAQAVRTHPGPLGYFFRRLKKRKPHNVAVVAVAHKLVLLAWHLLTKGEPYRYALPQATQKKLRQMRVQATGEKRRPGLPPGPEEPGATSQAAATGSNRLPEVYANDRSRRLSRACRRTAAPGRVEARTTLPTACSRRRSSRDVARRRRSRNR